MKEGPSESASKSRFQTTSDGCCKEQWSEALEEKLALKLEGMDKKDE